MGNLGWVSDIKDGYRYQATHPVTGKKWPMINDDILKIWKEYTQLQISPDCCLINYYTRNAKMGMHIDNDEYDFSYPVLSISIGASACFRIGGLERRDKTRSIKLNNGDLLVFSGKSRLLYHGVDKIYTSHKYDYRINLTIRKAI